jgi:hypothetical protein
MLAFREFFAQNTEADLGASHVLTVVFVRSSQMECEDQLRSSTPLGYCLALHKVYLLVLIDFELQIVVCQTSLEHEFVHKVFARNLANG